MLRRQKYEGGIVMLSSDDAPPVDRPNLSKDYLAGKRAGGMAAAARPEVLFRQRHRPSSQYDRRRDRPRAREVALADGDEASVRSPASRDRRRARAPSHARARSHRTCSCFASLKDCQAIIERAKTARRVVVLGASFIGLEVAAALARAQHRGPCRRAGRASDGENSGARLQPPRASDPRGARRHLPSGRDGERHGGQARNA